MSLSRVAGWTLAAGTLLTCLVGYWLGGPNETLLEVPEELQGRMANLPESSYSDWLTELDGAIGGGESRRQVLIVQAIPDEQPLVIAAPQESDGDEETTHWRAPWEGVQKALQSGRLESPDTVRSRHAGFDYLHHLIPLDEADATYLLVNEMAPAPSWSGGRLLAVVLSLLLAAGLWITAD